MFSLGSSSRALGQERLTHLAASVLSGVWQTPGRLRIGRKCRAPKENFASVNCVSTVTKNRPPSDDWLREVHQSVPAGLPVYG